MAIIERSNVMPGTLRPVHTWRGSYDFAVDGGAQGAITLRSSDGALPAGAVVTGGYLDVTTACLSGSGTIAIATEGAADTLAASLQAALTVGRKDIIPDGSGSTAVKLTAVRNPAMTIATAAFTAGAFSLNLVYI
jgi:hypothetical protein